MDEDEVRLVVRVVLDVLASLDGRPTAAAAVPPAAAPGRRVVTERDVVDAVSVGRILVPRGCVVTPLARDTAAERGVELVPEG
jgi:hypothetical protein